MAEAITEMIIPSTYIEVRAEGLIGVSGVATGNVGTVGTASKGPLNTPVILSTFADARETFGEYDAWGGGAKNELTLVRTLQLLFANGASTVYAVRCAAAGAAAAKRDLVDKDAKAVVTLTARTPGTWGHDVTVQVKPAANNVFVAERRQTAKPALDPLHAAIAESGRNKVRVTKAATGQTLTYELSPTSGPTKGSVVKVDKTTGVMQFDAADAPVANDVVVASYEVDKSACREIEIAYGNTKEPYIVIDATDIARDVSASSRLVTATIAAGAAARTPDAMAEPVALVGGSNGEGAGTAEYSNALERLDTEPINIVSLGGQPFSKATATLLAHVEAAENNGRDRIAVVGAEGDAVATVADNAAAVADDRLILVAPGIRALDLASGATVSLGPGYAAAAVAGVIASLPVQVSPTNKAVRVEGLTTYYNDGELKKLLTSNVMPLEKKAGYRIVQGLTTDRGPFRQVSVRRIVDYAKAGTRIGSMPYIGRLNNARVRGALQATLNGFLSSMVLDERLTEFELSVTATRAEEIAGTCVVTMFLKPTFSIDYVKVIMNLA